MRVVTRLERMVARETIPNFLIGTALYIGVFLLWRILAQPYLTDLPARSFLPWLAYQIPNFALQAFPIAAVFTALIVFGRLARENELLAAHSGGVSLARMARPVLIFGALISALGFAVAEFVVPQANRRVSVTWWDGISGNALTRIAGKRLTIENRTLYFGSVAGEELRDVRIESWKDNTQTLQYAKTARINGHRLEMKGFSSYTVDHDRFPPPDTITSEWTQNAFAQIIYPSANPNATTSIALNKSKDQLIAENDGSGFEDSRSLSDLYTQHNRAQGLEQRQTAAMLGLKTALPLASFIILLFGVAVASKGARSSSVAFGYAVAIAIGYYIALYIGKTLGESGILPAFLAPWIANLGFLIAGVRLLRSRALR
jgi:lipopolysaccharide export system permease protein